MCTHRVKIAKVEKVDDELKSWIKEAYEMSTYQLNRFHLQPTSLIQPQYAHFLILKSHAVQAHTPLCSKREQGLDLNQ